VTAGFDAHAPVAAELACELGAAHAMQLANVFCTVVTDDAARLAVFAENGDSLLHGAAEKFSPTARRFHPRSMLRSSGARGRPARFRSKAAWPRRSRRRATAPFT
jgi:hypothetical protein